MSTARKLLWLAASSVILLLLTAVVASVYLYQRPEAVKSAVEGILSAALDAGVTLGELHYSLDPFRVEARNVVILSEEGAGRMVLTVPLLQATSSVEGSFGGRRLIVEEARVEGAAVELSGPPPPFLTRFSSSPSPLSKVAAGVFSWLVFEDVRLRSLELLDGGLAWDHGGGLLRLEEASLLAGTEVGVSASCRIQCEFPDGGVRVEVPALQLTSPHLDAALNGSAPFEALMEDGSLAAPDFQAEGVKLRLSAAYDGEKKRVRLVSGEILAAGVEGRRGGTSITLPLSLEISGGGEIDIKGVRVEIPRLELWSGDTFRIQSRASLRLEDSPEARFGGINGWVDMDALSRLLALPPSLHGLRMSGGRLELGGSLSGRPGQDGWSWEPDLALDLSPAVECAFGSESIDLAAALEGSARLRGTLSALDIDAKLVLNDGRGKWPFAAYSGSRLQLSLNGTYPEWEIRDLEIELPALKLGIGKRQVDLQPLRIAVPLTRLNVVAMGVETEDLRFSIPGLQRLRGSFRSNAGAFRATLEGEGLIGLGGAAGLGLLPGGWRIEARDRFSLRVSREHQSGFSGELDWRVRKLGFEDPAGVFLGEGVGLDLKARASTGSGAEKIVLDTEVRADAGEALYDRFYLDLGRYGLESAIRAVYIPRRDVLEIPGWRFRLGELFSAEGEGRLEKVFDAPAGRLRLGVQPTELTPLAQVFLKEPFQASAPMLSRMELEGQTALDLSLAFDRAAWLVWGFWSCSGGAVRLPEQGLELSGLSVLFPVWARSPLEGRLEPDTPLEGRCTIGKAVLPYVRLENQSWKLAAEPNGLRVAESLALPLAGGTVRMSNTRLSRLYQSGPTLETTLEVEALRLGSILSRIWPRPLEGSLNGRLEPVIIKPGTVSTDGNLRAELFGGTWVVSDPGIRAPFTSAPVLKVDASWRDVQLGLLTAETPFGRIEGVMEGRVEGLEWAAGQPQAFDLLLETVPREGVPQRISVEAVDSIASIGGGQSPFLGLAGGLLSLFGEFPYSKIGVHATLENDLFQIAGTIHEGGTEYLVKRSGMVGVNVVNQSPGSRIGFKDMMKRIQRIQTGTGEPLIE